MTDVYVSIYNALFGRPNGTKPVSLLWDVRKK